MSRPALDLVWVLLLALIAPAGCGKRSERAPEPSKTAAPILRDAGGLDAFAVTPVRTPACDYTEQQLPAPPGGTCPAPSAAVAGRLAPWLRKTAGRPAVTARLTAACAVGTGWIASAVFEDPELVTNEAGGSWRRSWLAAAWLPASGPPSSLAGSLLTALDLDGDGSLEPVTGTPSDLTIWFAARKLAFEVPPDLTPTWTVHDGRPALLVSDVEEAQAYNPLLGFSKADSQAYTFSPAGAKSRPEIVAALWQHSRGARCPGTMSDAIGHFDFGSMEPRAGTLNSLPPPAECEPEGAAGRQTLLAAALQHRRLVAAEKGSHDNYTSVEWLCRSDLPPTVWVSSQLLGPELWELPATGPRVSRFSRPHDPEVVTLIGAADFDGDGHAQLIFAFTSPRSGPPYDTDVKVRYRDAMLSIAHASKADPEPSWHVVRLPGTSREAFMFYAGRDWSWETAPPHLIGSDHGRLVELPAAQKQFLIEATASERRKLHPRAAR